VIEIGLVRKIIKIYTGMYKKEFDLFFYRIFNKTPDVLVCRNRVGIRDFFYSIPEIFKSV